MNTNEASAVEKVNKPSRFPAFAFICSKILPKKLPVKVVYHSKLKIRGMPIICIAEEAYGVIALGSKAYGIFAFGVYATGCFSIGVMATGFLSAGVMSLGLFSAFGTVAVSTGYAFGVMAIGSVAMGVTTFGIIETHFFLDGLFFRWDKPPV